MTEDQFLTKLIDSRVNVTIFLTSGIKLLGVVEGFDDNSLILFGKQIRQLIYKHSISTIVPSLTMS